MALPVIIRLDRSRAITYKQTGVETDSVAMKIPKMPMPEILPIFPLTGVLVLPGTVLPLHIFEPRYRNMVEDVLEGDKVFGMIQPFVPQPDNRPLAGAEKESPILYKIGCAGYIEKYEKSADGRFFIQLKGVNRFRFKEELELRRGYRRVRAIYSEFSDATLPEGWHCERDAILQALTLYGQAHGMQVKPDQAQRFSDLELVNLLSVSLPFHPPEKQALLEAQTLKDRENTLINLLRLGGGQADPDSDTTPRTLN